MAQAQSNLLRAITFLIATMTSHAGFAVTYPTPRLTDEHAGYLSVIAAGDSFRASAVIAKDPRLLFSCAHALYENGQWATSYEFSRAYHSSFSPSSGVSPRGFRYFSSYAGNVRNYGDTATRTFNVDFVVMYSFDGFGDAVGFWNDGGPVLANPSYLKRIVGYPATIDYTGVSGEYYQHSTDYFLDTADRIEPEYYIFDNVTTGAGNSGGPVYAYDNGDYLAGILVSGTETTAGVRVLDSAALTMATDALRDATGTGQTVVARTVSNTKAFSLPDKSTTFSVRKFAVNLTGTITRLLFSANITTTFRGDLDVYLRAPSGRVQWISKRSGGAADNLITKNANYTVRYRGFRAAGNWGLYMRDAVAGDRARFNSATLKVSAAN